MLKRCSTCNQVWAVNKNRQSCSCGGRLKLAFEFMNVRQT